MYKLFNEDNTLVKDYPAPEIYKTLSDEEKNNIFTIKNEIEKITESKGLGKVSVNVDYDGVQLEKEFLIKHSNGYSEDYYKKEIVKIYENIAAFSKKENIFDFFLGCYISIK